MLNNTNQSLRVILTAENLTATNRVNPKPSSTVVKIRFNTNSYLQTARNQTRSTYRQLQRKIEILNRELSMRLYSMDMAYRNRVRVASLYLNQNSVGMISPLIAAAIISGESIEVIIDMITNSPQGNQILQLVQSYTNN